MIDITIDGAEPPEDYKEMVIAATTNHVLRKHYTPNEFDAFIDGLNYALDIANGTIPQEDQNGETNT